MSNNIDHIIDIRLLDNPYVPYVAPPPPAQLDTYVNRSSDQYISLTGANYVSRTVSLS